MATLKPPMRLWLLARAVVCLRRIAIALERAHPPVPVRVRRPTEFSVSTVADFDKGYDESRNPVEDVLP